ncbi:EspA/EspE family type VII secretion system effector [[Mycobacterium] fortunisiensis]|uniref:EspA/EspE family type VII secretion system effector n=1 Tax=[Mycobacterium] fortunisiensis TaxID=2600579 RepID=UPI001C251ED3|nr:EspA/EspE family type VII secretion system effector [[Mycobacterium] fortunisiensis]
MSALDGFHSTWSQARETFGSGVPQDGTEFDKGADELRRMQSTVATAKPDSRWQGTAADSYAVKNELHAGTYGKLAELDQRMSAELNRSANVVTAGRQSLDQIHAWATSAAAATPGGPSGEKMKLIIANKGIGEITEVITQSSAEMAAIGDDIREIGREYEGVGEENGALDAKPASFHNWIDDAAETALDEVYGPKGTLDLADIRHLEPGQPGPPGYMELVPNSGTWVPDPNSPGYVPHRAKYPVDLDDIVYTEPGGLGPRGYTELVPDSGVWVPGQPPSHDPNRVNVPQPEYIPDPVTNPVRLDEIVRLAPGELAPRGYRELIPDSGVWVPE